MKDNPCLRCGFYDPDFGCMCPGEEKWYACPLEPEPDLSDFETEERRDNETV